MNRGRRSRMGFAVVAALALLVPTAARAEISDEELLAPMQVINEGLAADGLNIAIEQIEFYTQGRGPSR